MGRGVLLNRPRKPRLTALVLDGLSSALTDHEATMDSDRDNVTAAEDRAFNAADKWLRGMYAYRNAKKAAK